MNAMTYFVTVCFLLSSLTSPARANEVETAAEKLFRRLESLSGEVTTPDGKILDARGFLEAQPKEFFLTAEQDGVALKFKAKVSLTAKGARSVLQGLHPETGKVLARRSFEVDFRETDVESVRLRIAQTASSLAREIASKLHGAHANRPWIHKMKNALASVVGIPDAYARKEISSLTAIVTLSTGILTILTSIALHLQLNTYRAGLKGSRAPAVLVSATLVSLIASFTLLTRDFLKD